MKRDAGFTLIEVVIAVAVVAVMAAIAFPSWADLSESADVAALQAEVSATAQYLYVFELEGNELPYPEGEAQVQSVESLLGFDASHDLSVYGSGATLCVDGATRSGQVWSYAIFGGLRQESCATPALTMSLLETPDPTPEPEPDPTSTPEPEPEPDPYPALTTLRGAGQWGHAFFTHGDIQLTNGVTVQGGPIYSPGQIRCNSNSRVTNFVVAETFEATNNCVANGVWVNGDVQTSSSPLLGDVYARGGLVAGNSTVQLSGNVTVGRTATALDGGSLSFGGQYTPGADVPPIPQYAFPQVSGDQAYWEAKGFTWQSWATWLDGQARANSAPNWVSFINDPCKQISQASWSVNGPVRSPSVPTVLDARTASKCNLTFSGANSLVLNADLTIIVDSLSGSGALNVTSGTGERHTLRLIAAWPDSFTSCSDVPTNHKSNISLAGAAMRFSDLTPTLVYSPSRISLSNDIQGSGAIYSCNLSLSNNVVWTLDSVAP